jgi:hypothetical protein
MTPLKKRGAPRELPRIGCDLSRYAAIALRAPVGDDTASTSTLHGPDGGFRPPARVRASFKALATEGATQASDRGTVPAMTHPIANTAAGLTLRPRTATVQAYQYIYASSTEWLAATFNGIVTKNGELWLEVERDSSDEHRIQIAPIPCWIVKDSREHLPRVMTEAEVTQKYEPVSQTYAKAVLGGRCWPNA